MSGPSSEVGSAYATVGFKTDESGLNAAKSKFNSAIDGMESRAKSAGAAIGSALKTGVEAAAVAAAAVGVAGVKTYMDVESAAAGAAAKMDLSAIAQKSGTTIEKAFDGVKQHVMDLSDELGQLNTNAFDPTTIARACNDLAANGFDVATASAADLSPMLSLATATNYDLGESAGMAMAAMNTFGLGVSDISHIADVYTTACGASAVGMSDLNYAMQMAGPTAAAYGMDLETLTANIETFSQMNIKGEKSGTAMRDVINTLGAPSGTAAKALAELGFKTSDVDLKSHDLNETLGRLKAAADSSGRGVSAFVDVFGVSGGLLYQLASANDQTVKFKDQLLNCGGAAEQMARLMLNNLKGSMEAALGAASSLAYLIGGKLAPTLQAAFEWFSASGAPAIREFINAVADGDWTKAGQLLSKGIRAGWDELKDLGKLLYGWLKAVNWGGLWSYITGGIKTAWNGLYSLGGQLLGWLKSVDWGSVGQAILSSISGIGKSLYSSITSIKWADVGTTILSGLRSTLTFLEGVGQTIYSAIVSVKWAEIGTSILDGVKGIPAKIQSLFSEIDFGNAWDSLVSSASSAATSIYDTLSNIRWANLGYEAGKLLSGAIESAINTLSSIGTTIAGYLKTASTNAGSIGTDIGEKIKGGLATVSGWMEQAKAGFLVGFGDTGQKIGNLIKDGLALVTDYAKAIYDNIYTGLKKWVEGNDISNIGKDAGATFVKGIGAAIYLGAKATLYVWSKLYEVLTNAPKWLAIGIEAALKFTQSFVQGALNTLADGVALGILLGVKAALSGLVDWNIPGVSDWAKSNMGPLDTEITKLKTSLTSIGDMHVEPSMDVDTEYIGGSDPSSLQGKTYDTTVKVSYVGTSGGLVAFGSGLSTKITTGFGAGGTRQESSVVDWVKAQATADATWEDVRDTLLTIKSGSNNALQRSDIEYLQTVFENASATQEDTTAKVADIQVAAAEKAAAIEQKGADAEAKTESDAAKSGADTLIAGHKFASEWLVSKLQEGANAVVAGGQAAQNALTSAAQNALTIGNSVSAKFQGAGDAVKVAMDASTGKLTAYIGSAGDKLSADGTTTGAAIKLGGTSAQNALQLGSTQAKTSMQSGADGIRLSANHLGAQGQSAGNSLATGGSSAAGSLMNGAASAASSIRGAASSLTSAIFNLPVGKWASGTVTSGPQMALIGEDGPGNPEFVIPTRTKRWDLLYQAMRAYGIPGYAEGTATGGTGTGGAATDAEEMRAYFGIKGLASMSSQVQRIISDLKDFFRISWTIIKSEGAVSWKGIEAVIVNEATFIRDSAWQGVLDIRNAWLSSNAAILADATTSYAAIWPAISPSMQSIHDSTIASFEDTKNQSISVLNNMNAEAIASLQDFEAQWAGVWSTLLGDLQSTQSQISSIVQQIAAQVSNISVNVALNSYGGGGSSGDYYGGWSPEGGGGDWLSCGDINIGSGSSCSVGSGVSGGCPSYIDAVIASTGPLATAGLGVTARAAQSSSSSSSSSSYQLPAIFRAKGALIDDGPELDIVGEAGPEMILPPNLTRMFLDLANAGLGANAPANSGRIIIEDHTVHEHYWNGKKVTDLVMTTAKKKMDARGGIPTK